MTIVIILAAVLLLGAIIGLIIYSSRHGEVKDDLQSRLEEYASMSGQALSLEEIELSQPFYQRIIQPMLLNLAGFFSRFTPAKTIESTRHNLELAGRPYHWSEKEFFGFRILAGLILGAAAFLLLTITKQSFTRLAGGTAILAILGYMLPVMWISSKIKKRQEEIIKSLPDSLDLITITVEAGLGFDQALAKVAQKWNNELSRAFARVIHEIRLGKSRAEALRAMDNNVGVPDITSFAAAIIQADQLGVSIAKVMRVQSEQMRIRRRQRAEKKAHEAPIKMLFPLVFLIFPAIFIVLLGPAALQVMASGALKAIGQ